MDVKDTNPKDAVGIAKVPLSVIPAPVLAELALALLEGARKYGRHNWRAAKARASVYYDAAARHLMAWYEGEDIDPDSDLNHITKAIASLTVLRDAMIQEKWVDDRPPPCSPGWLAELNKRAAVILEKYPDCVEPWTATRYRDAFDAPVIARPSAVTLPTAGVQVKPLIICEHDGCINFLEMEDETLCYIHKAELPF